MLSVLAHLQRSFSKISHCFWEFAVPRQRMKSNPKSRCCLHHALTLVWCSRAYRRIRSLQNDIFKCIVSSLSLWYFPLDILYMQTIRVEIHFFYGVTTHNINIYETYLLVNKSINIEINHCNYLVHIIISYDMNIYLQTLQYF